MGFLLEPWMPILVDGHHRAMRTPERGRRSTPCSTRARWVACSGGCGPEVRSHIAIFAWETAARPIFP